jgi:hypothetical protein
MNLKMVDKKYSNSYLDCHKVFGIATKGAYRVTYQPQEHHCLSISGRLPRVVDLERGTDNMGFHCDDKLSTVREVSD